MKHLSISGAELALALTLLACGNGGNDSVKDAKAANEARIDSQKTSETPPSSKKLVSKEAADFLVYAYSGSLAAVQLGSLAQTHSSNPEIKAFGAMMVKDHSDHGERLRAVADSLHVTLPVTISNSQQKMIKELQKRSGMEFDKAYIARMVSDHKDDINEFERQAKKGFPEVSAFANSSLPMLRKHLDSAVHLQKMLGFAGITVPPPPYQ